MSRRLLPPAALLLLGMGALVVAPSAHAADPDQRVIFPEHPWAKVIEGELSKTVFEQTYGPDAEQARLQFAPIEQDGMLIDRDSWSNALLTSLDLPPLHAANYEPTVGIMYVAMEGVTLKPNCGNGDSANAALNCSPLVDQETNFPAMSGGGNQAALFQQLAAYYEPFNVVMTTTRPPDYLPYTMAVVGGSAGLAGQQGACGVANVACDGLKRNHVSLTFPQSCGGSAGTAAQETAHNWGLEHTDNGGDLMFPFNDGSIQSFVDQCMNISHATGDGITQCSYIHEEYCPQGGGEQQNSFAELMGVFGPRQADDSPPQITSIQPANGSVFNTSDDITITASISENSGMVGVKWTWLEGNPEGDSYTKCTNKVCDADFNPGVNFDASSIPWDFVAFDGAPAGTYSFQLEVMDAYANYATETITFEVMEQAGGDDDDDDDDDDSADESGDGGVDGGDDDDDDASGDDDDDDDDDDMSDGTGGDVGADGGVNERGCSVTRVGFLTGTGSRGVALLGLLLFVAGRRRSALG